MPLQAFILVLALSVGVTLLLTPLTIRLGKRYGLVAMPGGRRTHKGAVVRIGGLPLYPAFLIAALATWGIPRQDSLELTRLIGVLVGLGMAWVVGLLDDRFRLPAWVQFAGLFLAALVAIPFQVFIELFNSPFTDAQIKVDWYLMVPITLFWLIGMTGTMNFLDGLDGLATGVTAISALVLFLHMLNLGQYSVSLLPLALLGCCLGFLPYNSYPARIFLGGGAYLLGYALGAVSIVAGAKVASALLVVWLPIVDVVWQIYSRWRRGQPVSLGDRGHLHLRLQDLGWNQRWIVFLYYIITALLGAAALLIASRLLKLILLAGGGLLILIILFVITRATGDETTTGR